jgi:hypothetical protein
VLAESKGRQMAAFHNAINRLPCQASRKAELDLRRYATKPIPKKPRIIIAQVEGSGTAVTETLSRAGPKANG